VTKQNTLYFKNKNRQKLISGKFDMTRHDLTRGSTLPVDSSV